jgi:hypothetical protein
MHPEMQPYEGGERLQSAWIKGVLVQAGSPVRLYPSGRDDILDLALRGKSAAVDSIEVDFEGRVFVAVILDEVPGHELGRQGPSGHRLFYRAEEIEPLVGNERRYP